MHHDESRRTFLKAAAGTAGMLAGASALPASVRKALEIVPHRRTGTIQDVEHVVILMQENRSFDHYFGTLRGVRGFNDPRPVRLPNGRPVWYQPPASVETERYHNRGLEPNAPWVLPFYINPQRTTINQAGTDHGWSSGHLSWNQGHWNQWVTQKQDVMTMGYLKRQDVSLHYALADAFTLCDAYHCSIHADTAPNRIYLWSGTCDPRNAWGTKANGPGLWERHHVNGYTWITSAEILQRHGISWKLYQGGTGIPGTPTDNYTDNSLEFFSAYQVEEGADPAGALVRNGVSNHTLRELRDDVVNGRLAQVTWIVAPYIYSEHPEASPEDGAFYINTVLEALTADPEVWSRTVLLINYDENDGLFDHVVPPMPPLTSRPNAGGMVSKDLEASLGDEILNLDDYPEEMHPLVPGADSGGLQPIGLGPRVPLLIISPWSRGGWVCSELFDHTSVLRFLEARFGIHVPTISAWRRSLCGDLTSAFDFAGAVRREVPRFELPKTVDCEHKPYSVPRDQTMPTQEPGVRLARALPYQLVVNGQVDGQRITLDFDNQGRAGVGLNVYNRSETWQPPRRYAISAGDRLEDYWESVGRNAGYDLAVYGPNGSLFEFRGPLDGKPVPEVHFHVEPTRGQVVMSVHNATAAAVDFTVKNEYGPTSRLVTLAADERREFTWNAAAHGNWFDVSVAAGPRDGFLRRYAGHVEDGRASTSDPGGREGMRDEG